MNRNIDDIKRKTFFGVLWKFMERTLAQVITFIVSLVLARILSPNEYGIIAIVITMINLMNVFVTSGYGAALIQNEKAGDKEFNTMFTFSGALSVVLYFLLFFLAPFIARLYQEEILTLLIRVMGLRLPIASFNAVQQAYVAKKMEYQKFFWATLGGTIVSSAVGITMAVMGCGVWALVGQYFTNVLIDSVVLYCTFSWRYKPYFSWSLAKPMIRFGSGVLLASLVDAVYQEVRTIIVGVKYNTERLAYYNRGEQFPKLFALNIGTAIDGTLLPTFSLLQDDLEKMRQAVRRTVQISTLLVSPIMLGMAAIAESMIRVLLTDKWLDAVPYVQVFCAMYALNPLISASNQVIKAMGASGLYLKIEIAKKTIFMILIIAAIPFGPLVIAGMSVIATIISCLVNAVTVRKLINLSLTDQILSGLPQYFYASIMMFAIVPLRMIIKNVYLLLILQILAGVIVYFSIIILARNKAFLYLMDLVKRFWKERRK